MPLQSEPPAVGSYEHVTGAWNRIHSDHPEIHRIASPKLISRMRHRDFPKIVLATCNLPRNAAILEAGCGSGRDSLYFSSLGYRCTAVDIHPSPLEKLARARDRLHTSQQLQLAIERADIFHLPFQENTFDLVFNSGVVEHYNETTRGHLLTEMARVTRSSGFIAVAFPNKAHLFEGYWRTLAKAFTDFDSYEIPEQELGDDLGNTMNEVGLEVCLRDWIDCYDTISRFPSWLPLKAVAYAATVVLPRPPLRLRRRCGIRALVIARKRAPKASA